MFGVLCRQTSVLGYMLNIDLISTDIYNCSDNNDMSFNQIFFGVASFFLLLFYIKGITDDRTGVEFTVCSASNKQCCSQGRRYHNCFPQKQETRAAHSLCTRLFSKWILMM